MDGINCINHQKIGGLLLLYPHYECVLLPGYFDVNGTNHLFFEGRDDVSWKSGSSICQDKLAAKDREMEKLGEQHQLHGIIRRCAADVIDPLVMTNHRKTMGKSSKKWWFTMG